MGDVVCVPPLVYLCPVTPEPLPFRHGQFDSPRRSYDPYFLLYSGVPAPFLSDCVFNFNLYVVEVASELHTDLPRPEDGTQDIQLTSSDGFERFTSSSGTWREVRSETSGSSGCSTVISYFVTGPFVIRGTL